MSRKTLGPYLVVGLALACAPLAASAPGTVSGGSQAPPPSSTGGTLTASFDNPELGHMDFTITGANLKMKGPNPLTYEGAATGTTITLSGHMSFTEPKGYKTYLSLGAQIGGATWHWPAKGGSEEFIGPRSVSQSFNLTFKVGSSKIYDKSVSASVSMQLCGGICSGYQVNFNISLPSSTTSAPKPTTPTPTTTKPSSHPTVKVFPPTANAKGTGKSGQYWRLELSVWDASGKATAYATLFQGGERVRYVKGTGPATGKRWSWNVMLGAQLTGPMYWCAYAVNPRGDRSVGNSIQGKPYTSCAFIPMEVPIKRVSNGCGGEGWAALVWVENYFGNDHTYYDSVTGQSYPVSFVDACDLHDAGYAGTTVADKINGGVKDMHGWTRKMVDEEFWRNMQKLCADQIPAGATDALAKCRGTGGSASIGSQWLFNKVRDYGHLFFDADLTTPGTQKAGMRDNT